MEKRINVKEWINNYINGEYDEQNINVQCNAGWWDWFCKDTSLKNKTKYMGNIIKKLKDSSKLNLETSYVWFKNCCPISHPLYDQFKISDIKTQDVLYCININSAYEKNKFTVYSKDDWNTPIFGCEKSKELVEWFNK